MRLIGRLKNLFKIGSLYSIFLRVREGKGGGLKIQHTGLNNKEGQTQAKTKIVIKSRQYEYKRFHRDLRGLPS